MMPQPEEFGQFVAVRLANPARWAQGPGMIPRSPLDDPRLAAFAWARFRRLMWFMLAITVTMVIGALVLLYRENGLVSIHFYIATALGIGFAMLLMSALMGLVFLSSGTGHDDSVVDPLADEWRDKPD
jgi:hypothetical protein